MSAVARAAVEVELVALCGPGPNLVIAFKGRASDGKARRSTV